MSTCSNLVCVSATLLTATLATTALLSLLPKRDMSGDCVDWNAQMDRVDDAYNAQMEQYGHCMAYNPSTATDLDRLTYLKDCTGSEAESRSLDLFRRSAHIRDNKPTNCKRTRILENVVHFKGSDKPQNHQKAHR